MQVGEAANGKSDFRCTIEVVLPLVARIIGPVTGTNYFIRQHLIEETKNSAEHLAKKFAAPRPIGKLSRLTTAHAA